MPEVGCEAGTIWNALMVTKQDLDIWKAIQLGVSLSWSIMLGRLQNLGGLRMAVKMSS